MEECLEVLEGEVAAGGAAALCEKLLRALPAGEEEEESIASFEDPADWINLTGAIVCMLMAAMAAGLTLGTASLEALDLRVKERCGTDSEKKYAARLRPLLERSPHHQLLVTLLLLNATANEALPIFLDALVPSFMAILISVTVVLFAGEIIPAAIFTGPAKLRIAATLAPLVHAFLWLTSPLSWPLGWLLDRLVPDEGHLPSRMEMQAGPFTAFTRL